MMTIYVISILAIVVYGACMVWLGHHLTVKSGKHVQYVTYTTNLQPGQQPPDPKVKVKTSLGRVKKQPPETDEEQPAETRSNLSS